MKTSAGVLSMVVAVVGLGCVGAPGAAPPSDTDEDTSTGATVGSTGPGPSTTPVDTGSTTVSVDGSSTSMPPVDTSTGPMGGGPAITISDGRIYDFGQVELGATGTHVFLVGNDGDAQATGLSGGTLAAPFAWAGGAYPGANGTCGDTLDPLDTCELEVEFAPTDPGLFGADLVLMHDDGEATRPVAGAGAGVGANLLINGDGEMEGTPPPAWTNEGLGEWVAGPGMMVGPFEGNGMLYALTGPDGADYVLRQDVAVDAWATTIDLGLLDFGFGGMVRALFAGNDEHRIRVMYLDDADALLDEFDTDWGSNDGWQPVSDVRAAPAGTRTVRVELMCLKSGGMYCSAFYDLLELRASFP